MGFIYILENRQNGKCYVGQTVQEIKKRFYQHKCKGKSRINRPINNAINKYGFDRFNKYIFIVPNELLDYFEIELIERLKTTNKKCGYNISIGGNSLKNRSKESIKRQSESLKRRYKKNKHPCSGLKLSEETKLKISKANKGKPSAFKGRKHTEESKNKMREATTGRVSGKNNPNYGNRWTDEMKKSLSLKRTGMKLNITDEQRRIKSEQTRNRNLGRKWSDKTKKRISETRIKRKVAAGKNNPNAKKIKCIETDEIFDCMKDAAKKYNISYSSFKSKIKRKIKIYNKYTFVYI